MSRKWNMLVSTVNAWCAEVERGNELLEKTHPFLIDHTAPSIIYSLGDEEYEHVLKLQVLAEKCRVAAEEWREAAYPPIKGTQPTIWEKDEPLPDDKDLYH
jgi:hypothetical protein